MSDVVVTAGEVLVDAGTVKASGIAGASITAGQALYLDTATDTWKLADANGAAALNVLGGIALNSASSGQPIFVATDGTLDPGFTVTVAAVYVLSANAGGIAPVADLAQGWKTSIVGVGITASQLRLKIYNSLVAVP